MRLENGWQVCWANYSTGQTIAINVANSGWGYRSGQQDAPLPAPFIAPVRTMVTPNVTTVGVLATAAAASATNFTFHLISGANVTAPSMSLALLAIGRWK